MSKQQVNVKLTGMVKTGIQAKTHQAKEVKFFEGTDEKIGTVFIDMRDAFFPKLITKKATYALKQHESMNYMVPSKEIPGVKIHVCLKKVTGQLSYWA